MRVPVGQWVPCSASGKTLRALALMAAGAVAGAAGQPSFSEAQREAAQRRAAADAASRATATAAAAEERLAQQRVEAARRAQEADALVDNAQQSLQDAVAARDAAEQQYRERAAALAPMLPLMRRLALWPSETLLAVPAPPDEALRGVLVLQGMARQVEAEARTLRAARAEANRLALLATGEAERLQAARNTATAAAAALDAQLAAARARRAGLADAEAMADRRAAEAAARASNLQQVVARLALEKAAQDRAAQDQAEAEARAEAKAQAETRQRAAVEVAAHAPPDRPATAAVTARGGRVLPVAGRVLRGFGDRGEAGPSRGLTLAAPPGARVVSPCAGRAVFSGPFRSFGLLLIVDCGEGYHFVLAGLDRLDATVGQRLLAGEPVGVVTTGPAAQGADPTARSARATLYVELRRNGQPVDPRGWLRGSAGGG